MRKRNCRVQVRLDNKEYQGFMKAVRKSGLSQEVYLRHLINGVVPQDAPPPDYYHFMRELHSVGNNLWRPAYHPFHLRVFPDKRADGGCGKAAGGIRARPPWKGGEAHGQGH